MYLSETTNELYRWFDILNSKYFDDKLEKPIITIQKTRGNTLGWFTTDPLWHTNGADDKNDDKRYEINISAQGLEITPSRTIHDIVAILLHEMVHYYNKAIKNVKDCSGKNHNKKFMEEAKRVDLIVEKDKKVGYGYTFPAEALIKFIDNEIKPNKDCLVYYRKEPEKTNDKEPPKKYKYECPNCHRKFNAKEDTWEISCKKCGCDFEVEEI